MLWRSNWSHFCLGIHRSLQELNKLAILLEPLAHAKLVQTRTVVICHQNSEKILLGCVLRKRVHLQWYLFWRYCTFFNHHIFPDPGPRKRKCSPPTIWYSAMVKHRRYRCHIIFCSLCICKRTVGPWDSLFSSLTRSLAVPVVRFFGFLGSKIHWGCDH